jgi:selenocysteine lyase/cysteine desulfurase
MDRRQFLVRSSAALGAVAAASGATMAQSASPASVSGDASDQWNRVRMMFRLDPNYAHMAGFFLVSHPAPVRKAIDEYRNALDLNPIAEWHDHHAEYEDRVRAAAGKYLDVNGEREIALTDSTTMGLGLLYNSLKLREDQEILTSEHDHYATHQSLRFRAERTGAKFNKIRLYEDGSQASVDEIVSAVTKGLTPRTRIVALTWVHSCSGVKLPLRQIADAIAEANKNREPGDRAIFCVDGVHGLGVEDLTIPQMGCDFFVAGTHKWIFSPRGTGILWGREELWPEVVGTIPPFGPHEPAATLQTPGGFHSFEHRWATNEGFDLHMRIGKRRVHDRLHALNRRIREGLASMKHVTSHTPMSDELSAGIVCFDVKGMAPAEVVERLLAKKIIASESPYTPSCPRLSASLWNTEAEIDNALGAVAEMA